ncbi:Peroxisomal 2,4-dienoyl-CoA reductase [Blomia tropicalis]|nr:Peroxisomal 2,4-dienoyl-CoA reductase [Blomia tropicalis]
MSLKEKSYDFTGKVAIVTGSSSGIGSAIALQLASNGALVVITGRSESKLETISKKIETISNRKPLQMVGDLLNRSFAPKLVEETIEKYGRIDYLVNNAGAPSHNESFDNDKLMNQFDNVMDLNVRSILQLIQLCAPHLEQSKGSIVNISSAASMKPWMLLYSTAKAALDMLTKTSAGCLASKGIRVNSINPGPVYTSNGRFFATEDYYHSIREQLEAMTALKRIGNPDDVANVALFLLSDQAINMTGSIVACDGGVLVCME